jgi:hypothetical protein
VSVASGLSLFVVPPRQALQMHAALLTAAQRGGPGGGGAAARPPPARGGKGGRAGGKGGRAGGGGRAGRGGKAPSVTAQLRAGRQAELTPGEVLRVAGGRKDEGLQVRGGERGACSAAGWLGRVRRA